MESSKAVVIWRGEGSSETWSPTTLDVLGKDEKFLETAIAEHPGLMRLETRRTGVRGPFVAFRQVRFETPQGRPIRPDIVFFTASGHVVVVEVKLANNAELRDRRVLAQIVDYAASFSALTADELLSLFAGPSATSWASFVEQLFPHEEDCNELAEILMGRLRSGELNLVIACDKAPTGLQELLEGVATQSALGFDLDLVEVTPHVNRQDAGAGVLLAPHTRLATEVVSRTAVTVTYRQGESRPSTDVRTTSIKEIQENVERVGRRRSGKFAHVVDVLTVEPMTMREIQEAAELDETCHDFLNRLVERGKVIKTSKDGRVAFALPGVGGGGSPEGDAKEHPWS